MCVHAIWDDTLPPILIKKKGAPEQFEKYLHGGMYMRYTMWLYGDSLFGGLPMFACCEQRCSCGGAMHGRVCCSGIICG